MSFHENEMWHPNYERKTSPWSRNNKCTHTPKHRDFDGNRLPLKVAFDNLGRSTLVERLCFETTQDMAGWGAGRETQSDEGG